MAFSTDKQTLQDLRIFDTHDGTSLFDLFNRCTTRGGAAMLQDMFLHPLNNREAIGQRINIFSFFAKADISFPVTGILLDAIEPYLQNRDERTRFSANAGSSGSKLAGFMDADPDAAIIRKGIAAMASLIQELAAFVKIIDAPAYRQEQQHIQALLDMPAFSQITGRNPKLKLTPDEMEWCDGVFRFKYRNEIEQLLNRLYLLDVYMTVGKLAATRGFIFPEPLPAGNIMIELEGVYHPSIRNAVPNSIVITASNNVLFLTGANMAGKSTFMRTLSIALYLAHMGFPVPAVCMRFQVLDGIYTTINLPDNLGIGASHFYAEVLRLKKVAHEISLGKKLFVLFDELFRGTNVKDAYDATVAVTTAFAQRKTGVFVLSTHIIEAGDILQQSCSGISYLYLPANMNGNEPVYSYTLQPGITGDRHGMVIITNEKILDILEQGLQQSVLLS